jgi:prohibitin 1
MFDRFSGVKHTVSNSFAFLSTQLTSRTQASSEGTHFLVPWLQKAILFDVRTKPKVRATVRDRTVLMDEIV